MKVVLTAAARDDLEEIGDFIAKDSPKRARSFVRELIEAARRIGDIPQGDGRSLLIREIAAIDAGGTDRCRPGRGRNGLRTDVAADYLRLGVCVAPLALDEIGDLAAV